MSGPPRFDRVATVVQRLAVLTAAGIAPVSAWKHAEGAARPDPVVSRVVDGLTSAYDLPQRISHAARDRPPDESSAWRSLAAVWSTASEACS